MPMSINTTASLHPYLTSIRLQALSIGLRHFFCSNSLRLMLWTGFSSVYNIIATLFRFLHLLLSYSLCNLFSVRSNAVTGYLMLCRLHNLSSISSMVWPSLVSLHSAYRLSSGSCTCFHSQFNGMLRWKKWNPTSLHHFIIMTSNHLFTITLEPDTKITRIHQRIPNLKVSGITTVGCFREYVLRQLSNWISYAHDRKFDPLIQRRTPFTRNYAPNITSLPFLEDCEEFEVERVVEKFPIAHGMITYYTIRTSYAILGTEICLLVIRYTEYRWEWGLLMFYCTSFGDWIMLFEDCLRIDAWVWDVRFNCLTSLVYSTCVF